MKRKEFKLLIESWRKDFVFESKDQEEGAYLEDDEAVKELESELKESEEDDIFAPFDAEGEMDDNLLGDDDMSSSEMDPQIPSVSGEDDREDMLRKFCDTMGIECTQSEIHSFLAGQAFNAGYNMDGVNLDDLEDEIH